MDNLKLYIDSLNNAIMSDLLYGIENERARYFDVRRCVDERCDDILKRKYRKMDRDLKDYRDSIQYPAPKAHHSFTLQDGGSASETNSSTIPINVEDSSRMGVGDDDDNGIIVPFMRQPEESVRQSCGSLANATNGITLRFSGSTLMVLIILIVQMILVTVLGNMLVMVAFVVDKNLRTQSNFFLLNLAICDFFVGAFCIPVYIPYFLTGKWILGKHLCKLWIVTDYLMCSSSVFNIVLISHDRFLSVTRAAEYRVHKDLMQVVFKMVAVWLAAFFLYGPWIISWEYFIGKSIVPEDDCYAEFSYTWYFLLCAAVIEFFTPFISVTYFNLCIYWCIRKRKRKQQKQMNQNKNHTCHLEIKERKFTFQHFQFFYFPKKSPKSLPQTKVCKETLKFGDDRRHNVFLVKLSRDKKIAKSLAIIVCSFGLCWVPYTLLNIVNAACGGQCVEYYWFEITFWLLWCNSSVNPFLYPFCHSSFRKAFAKVLCCNTYVRGKKH
ncbi:histamine H3 receptor-like [Protopterus annectens]|uniref:histamine H3 receptor-like n=1 Tax=Protopterus annectens TaxID=7888 RepID=UPI001CFBF903|nr:histamine H3 receptor-like [Protopterus annectens]